MELNQQRIAHPGYSNTNSGIEALFSMDTVLFISKKVTELLRQFYPQGVVVPLDLLINVLNAIYEAYRPSTGDIYSRYTIPSNENQNCIDEIINQTVQVVVTQVKDNIGMDQRNSQLTKWTSLLGDFNQQGLRSHPPIKTNKKKPQSLLINMVY
jgi:hypothetical protein